ncbi:MAG: hypothetical protein ABH849_04110 [Nanoarchaeota archaeon]
MVKYDIRNLNTVVWQENRDQMTIEEKVETDLVQPRDYIPYLGLAIRKSRCAVNDSDYLDDEERLANKNLSMAIYYLELHQINFVVAASVLGLITFMFALGSGLGWLEDHGYISYPP